MADIYALQFRKKTPNELESINGDRHHNNTITGVDNIALNLADENGVVVKTYDREQADKVPDGEYGVTGPPDDDRATWDTKMDFLLSIIGFAVDLANVWRFPYLCYRNGGGAFLIPYFLMLIFGAGPLLYLELLLGQFHREGPVTLWKITPIFKGIGWGIILISFIVAFYYKVIIGWAFYFLFASFTADLPWTNCNNEWNTCMCWNGTVNETVCNNVTLNASTAVSASAEYFDRAVLGVHQSSGILDLGVPRWQLALCAVLVYTILFLALCRGVHSSGKVVWVTATLPYILLIALLINGVRLDGALEGIKYFIVPRVDRLADPGVWVDAGFQIFYSVGAGFGVHLAYASYSKFDNNCYRDSIITLVVNTLTSILAGLVIFAYLGYMAFNQKMDIEKVATDGAGLVFVVYPEAIKTLPVPTVWAILFFLMLVTLGLDSSMGGLESVLTGVGDQINLRIDKNRGRRALLTAAVVIVGCLVSMLSVTYGGIYVFTLLDTYAAGTSLLFAVFIEVVAVAWFYGLNQLKKDVKQMLGFTPGIFWRVCWKFISPAFVLGVIIASIVFDQPLTYTSASGISYVYPGWANAIGWCIAGSSMILLPLVAIYKLIVAKGRTFSQKFAVCISPVWEHEAILNGGEVKRYKLKHWLTI